MTKCLILIPVGPTLPREFVQDTLDSFSAFMPADECEVWIMDDTERFHGLTAGDIPVHYVPRREVYPYAQPKDLWNAPLGLKLLRCMVKARESYDYDLVLRIDTDALITGPSPHRDAHAIFTANPDVAIIGAFRRRGDGSDKTEAMREAGAVIASEMTPLRMLKDWIKGRAPLTRGFRLRSLYSKARHESWYALGDTCTGGAVFISRAAVDRFAELGIHHMAELRFSRASEDWLFGLFTAAAGMRFAEPEAVGMAVNWRGLPVPPDEVPGRGVKVYHPVKLDDPSAQAQIRATFKAQRAALTG